MNYLPVEEMHTPLSSNSATPRSKKSASPPITPERVSETNGGINNTVLDINSSGTCISSQ